MFLSHMRASLSLPLSLKSIKTHPQVRIKINKVKKEIIPFATAWLDQRIIMLNEISQPEIDKYHMVSLICGI